MDDVVLSHCYPMMDAPAIGCVAAGLSITTGGIQVDRRCGSGLQAVLLYAAMQVQTGAAEVVLTGGTESMSNASFYSTSCAGGATAAPGMLLHDSLARERVTASGVAFPVPGGMIGTAEPAPGVLDRAWGAGRVRGAQPPAGRCGDTVVDRDEHIRPGSIVEVLAKLRPIMGSDDADATVTAGNASGQNDGATTCVVTSP